VCGCESAGVLRVWVEQCACWRTPTSTSAKRATRKKWRLANFKLKGCCKLRHMVSVAPRSVHAHSNAVAEGCGGHMSAPFLADASLCLASLLASPCDLGLAATPSVTLVAIMRSRPLGPCYLCDTVGGDGGCACGWVGVCVSMGVGAGSRQRVVR